MSKVLKDSAFHFLSLLVSVLPLWLDSILIPLGGHVESDPGLKRNSTETCLFCYWNLNSIFSHNYVKMFLLKAYTTVHKFDTVCLSEMYLDFSAQPDDDNLETAGYDIARADHPTNTKRRSVCIYHKKCLSLRVHNIEFLNQCIHFELRIGDKTCNFVVFYSYRSPSQSQDVFENFLENLKKNLR